MFGAFLLTFSLPIMIIISIAIMFDSPGPVLFKQIRVGENGRAFWMYKFRSMVVDAEKRISEVMQPDNEGNFVYKLPNDPRTTRIGRFLRKTSLDELPQLWNVIKGEMSLVGPRPHVQFEVNYYTPEQRRRLTVMPGLTGLWQVSGKADCSFGELLDLDLQYIDNWNLLFDIQIIVRTIFLMMRGGEGFWARMTKHVPGVMSRSNGNGSHAEDSLSTSYSLFTKPDSEEAKRESGQTLGRLY